MMKNQKMNPSGPSSHLCKALLQSQEKGMIVIEEMSERNTLTAEVVESLAVRIRYNKIWYVRSVSALHISSLKGMTDVLTKLLTVASVNPNVNDQVGLTPLHLAAWFCGTSSSMDCVRALAEAKNVDINAQDSDGWSPLMRAVNWCEETSSVECVLFLLSLPHIDFNLRDEYKRTAFAYAMTNPSAKEVVTEWVIDGLRPTLGGGGTLTRLIFPRNLHKLSEEELQRLNEAVANSTRLERVSCDCYWNLIKKELERNYSVIGFVDNEKDENWVLKIMERNRKARTNCFEASVQTFLIFKRKLNKDMGNLFASWVWKTRGTKIWSF